MKKLAKYLAFPMLGVLTGTFISWFFIEGIDLTLLFVDAFLVSIGLFLGYFIGAKILV